MLKKIVTGRKIRFAFVGCGRISGHHFKAFRDNADGCEVVAVCDEVRERAEAAARETGARAYTSYDEMLKCDCDAVCIATPSGLHPIMGVKAALAGRHVVTEKPIGITLKSVDEMIRACDDSGVNLFVIKQNRLNSTMRYLKAAVDGGRFGRLYAAHVNVFWQRPQEYYDMAKWRGTWEFDGGAFMNQASHYVDAVHWLVGEVESVMAFTGTLGRQIEAEDTGSAILKFRNGAIGSINVTMLVYPKNQEGSVTILGEKGTVKIGGIAVNKIEKWEFAEPSDVDELIFESNYEPPNVYGFGHTGYYKNVIEVLRGEAEPDTDGRTGRKTLELVLAIYRSARDGQRIPLPFHE